METLSLRQYGAYRKSKRLAGGSLQAVQKAITAGRIQKELNGRIDPSKADLAWSRNTHPGKSHGPALPVVERNPSSAVPAGPLSAKELIALMHDAGMANLTKLASAFGFEGLHLAAAPDILAAWMIATIGQDNIDGLFGESIPRLNRAGQRMEFSAEEDRQIDGLVNLAHRALGLEEIEIVKSKGKANRK